HELLFTATSLAIQAAKQGLGIAIAHPLLVESQIASKELIRPFTTALRRPHDIWLIHTKRQSDYLSIGYVCNWIENEASNTVANLGLTFTQSNFSTPKLMQLPNT